jgi:hypothetical protein
VTAGLLAHGSNASFRPSRQPNVDRQWHMRKKLAAYSCGRSRGFDVRLTAFPNTVTLLYAMENAACVNIEPIAADGGKWSAVDLPQCSSRQLHPT